MINFNKRISTPIALTVIALTIVAIGEIITWQYFKMPKLVACSEEAKICSDGSVVVRIGPNCEFAQCPTVKSNKTADWKTYNGKYFSFKYPDNWTNNTGSTSNYPNFLEEIHLRISPNAVFVASYINESYENYIRGLSGEKLIVVGREATKFELKGMGESLPVGFSIISVIVKDSKDNSYLIVFNGDRKDVTDKLIEQILSTFKFID